MIKWLNRLFCRHYFTSKPILFLGGRSMYEFKCLNCDKKISVIIDSSAYLEQEAKKNGLNHDQKDCEAS